MLSFDSLLVMSLSKDAKRYQNSHLTLRETPAANTTITGLFLCTESENPSGVTFSKALLKLKDRTLLLLKFSEKRDSIFEL